MRSPTVAVLVFLLCLGGAALTATRPYEETAEVFASDPEAGDFFGEQLALDRDRLVVGVDNKGVSEGVAYVFQRQSPGRWTEIAQLEASDGGVQHRFGTSVAVDGDTIAVGAGILDAVDPIYVFERHSGGGWREVARLEAPDAVEPGGGIGCPTIRGNTLIAGAPGDDELAPGAGALYVFERESGPLGVWHLVDKLFATPALSGANLGTDVALAESVIVAGAEDDDTAGDQAGAVSVFEHNGDAWEQVTKLTASDAAKDMQFGRVVATDGETIVVGAELDDQAGNEAGAVYVFQRDPRGVWFEVQKLLASDGSTGDHFGNEVAVERGTIVVGADQGDDAGAQPGGAVYVFERDETGAWSEKGIFRDPDGGDLDNLGEAVAISASSVVAGAPASNDVGSTAGKVLVFELNTGPQLLVDGKCPGELSFGVSSATSQGAFAITLSSRRGSTVVGSGPCTGTTLDLDQATLLRVFPVDPHGERSFERRVGADACGEFLQGVDGTTCRTTEVVQLPSSQ